MDEYELLLRDIEEILNSVPELHKVSHSKPLALGVETHFPAVYINPLNGVFDSKFNTKTLCGYDDYEYVRLIVNMQCINDLDWVALRSKLIKVILDDSAIWKNIINRDIVTWANDDFDSHPYKQFELGFEFRIRARDV